MLLDFVPSVFVFYSKRRTDSKENDFFFLSLTKIDCIVGGLFKNRVKFVSANSFVGILCQLRYFSEQVPTAHKKERAQHISYFTSFPVNFLKEGQRAKEGKFLNCTHILPLRKTSEKGTEKMKIISSCCKF